MLSRLRMLEEADFIRLPDAADGLGRGCTVPSGRSRRLTHPGLGQTRRYPLSRIRRMLLCACLGVEAGMTDGVRPMRASLLRTNGGEPC